MVWDLSPLTAAPKKENFSGWCVEFHQNSQVIQPPRLVERVRSTFGRGATWGAGASTGRAGGATTMSTGQTLAGETSNIIFVAPSLPKSKCGQTIGRLHKDIWRHSLTLSRARPVLISWFRCYCYCTTAQLAKSVQSAHCAHTQCTAGQGYLSIGTNLTWQQTLPHRDLLCSLSNGRHCWFWWLVIRAGRPQPDNREGDESCLAVLNNFYNDGVRWTLLYLSTGFLSWIS